MAGILHKLTPAARPVPPEDRNVSLDVAATGDALVLIDQKMDELLGDKRGGWTLLFNTRIRLQVSLRRLVSTERGQQ